MAQYVNEDYHFGHYIYKHISFVNVYYTNM